MFLQRHCEDGAQLGVQHVVVRGIETDSIEAVSIDFELDDDGKPKGNLSFCCDGLIGEMTSLTQVTAPA